MEAVPIDGVVITNWLSPASGHRVHLSLVILAFPYHTGVLIWGLWCTSSNHDHDDSDTDEHDDADDVPLITHTSFEDGVATFNPSFVLNADLDSDNDEHDDADEYE